MPGAALNGAVHGVEHLLGMVEIVGMAAGDALSAAKDELVIAGERISNPALAQADQQKLDQQLQAKYAPVGDAIGKAYAPIENDLEDIGAQFNTDPRAYGRLVTDPLRATITAYENFANQPANTQVDQVMDQSVQGLGLGLMGKGAGIAGKALGLENLGAGKLAQVFDGTIDKMGSIGDKIAALSKKMEALSQGAGDVVRSAEAMGDRVRDKVGEIVRGIEPSPEFLRKVEQAEEKLTAFESSMLKSATFTKAHNMAEQLGEDKVFALGTWVRRENTVRIAEYTGFAGDLEPNHDIFHSLGHEIGHLISDKLGRFEPVSAGKDFLDVIDNEIKEGNPYTKQVGQFLLNKFENAEGRSHEVFADCWAHAADQELGFESTNSYARMIRDAFPKTLEWVRS